MGLLAPSGSDVRKAVPRSRAAADAGASAAAQPAKKPRGDGTTAGAAVDLT